MQETTPTEAETTDLKRRYRCRHVFTEGHRCGSPSLRGQDLCYYHHASRREPSLAGHNGYFLMPRIDDRPAIQIALYDVLSRLSQFDIDPKRAGMLLYGLQIASSNLARHEKSAANTEPVVEDIVSNPFLGDLAPISEIPDSAPESSTQPGTEPDTEPAAPHLASEMWDATAEPGAPGSTASSSTLELPPTEPAPAKTSNLGPRTSYPEPRTTYLHPRTSKPRTFLASPTRPAAPNALQ